MLSDKEIVHFIDKEEIIIYPYEEQNLTPVGYNLTPSSFILSINNQLLVKIHTENDEKYCYIEPNDTVLIMTREAVKVSKSIAGTFHSKVSIVSKGFGHISTTLDPLWHGPLLISLNNPTNRRIKLTLAKIKRENNGDKLTTNYSSFVTLVFTCMPSDAVGFHDNPSGRFDILKKVVEKPVRKRMFRFGRNYRQYLKLKDMIDSIGSIKFINSETAEASGNITKNQFKQNYEDFSETLRFYTDLAQDTSRKIKSVNDSWANAGYLITGIGPPGVLIYFTWKFSEGGTIDGKVGLVAVGLAMLPWVFKQLKNIKKEK